MNIKKHLINKYLELPDFIKNTKYETNMTDKLLKLELNDKEMIHLLACISEFFATYNMFFINIPNKRLNTIERIYMYKIDDIIKIRKNIHDYEFHEISIGNIFTPNEYGLHSIIHHGSLYQRLFLYMFLYESTTTIKEFPNKTKLDEMKSDIIVDILTKKPSLFIEFERLFAGINRYKNNELLFTIKNN